MLTLPTLAVIVAGALAGGFVTGLAAFGTGLVALGIWLRVVDPAAAANLVAICSVVGQAQTLHTIRHAVEPRRVWPIVVAGLIGVPLGTLLLSHVDLRLFRLSAGLVLIGFSAFMLLGNGRLVVRRGGRPADVAVGLGGGILGGLSGLSGPLPIIWATLRGWPKDERRATVQIFNLAILAFVFVWHAATGLVGRADLVLAAVALPGTIIGAKLGASAYRRLSDRRFTDVVLVLLTLSGLSLVWGGL